MVADTFFKLRFYKGGNQNIVYMQILENQGKKECEYYGDIQLNHLRRLLHIQQKQLQYHGNPNEVSTHILPWLIDMFTYKRYFHQERINETK